MNQTLQKVEKTMSKMLEVIIRLAAIVLIPAGMLLLSVQSGYAVEEAWRGVEFTQPDKVYDMSPDWISQPIIYGPVDDGEDVAITLDQHLYPYLAPKINDYAEMHNLKITVNHGTCGITAGRLLKKTVDIGGFCCPPGATDRLPGIKFHTLGIAALLLIVHPDNPVKDVTFEEAQRIFMGDIGNWSEIENHGQGRVTDMQIQPIARLHCKLRPGHWRLLLANEDLFSPLIREVGAIPDMIYSVSSNPKAIGYETMTSIHRYFRDSNKISVSPLRINGFAHNETDHLLSGDYPLYRVFNLTTWEDDHTSNPHAQKLVEYLISEVEMLGNSIGVIPASGLREAGWEFHENELSGEPR